MENKYFKLSKHRILSVPVETVPGETVPVYDSESDPESDPESD